MRAGLALVGWAGLLVLGAGCGGDPRPAAVQAVKDTEAQWLKDTALKDPVKFASYYADDALVLSPHMPLIAGRNQIQAGLTTLMADPNFALTFHSTRVDAANGGDLVYTIGAYARTVSDPVTRQPVTDRGNYLTVWKKQLDGTWKVATDMDNSESPSP